MYVNVYIYCACCLDYIVVVTLIVLLTVVACKKHTKHQRSTRQELQYCSGQLNNYDDVSIATGLSDSGDHLKMKELKKEFESMDTSTPFVDETCRRK